METQEQLNTTPIAQTGETRICSNSQCVFAGQAQPLDAKHFAPDKRYAGHFRTECRRCESKRTKAYNKAHPTSATANRRKWARKNKDHVNAYQRKRYSKMSEAYKQQQRQLEPTMLQ